MILLTKTRFQRTVLCVFDGEGEACECFKTIRNYYFYCGIEKDEYNAVKKDAYISNFEVWKMKNTDMLPEAKVRTGRNVDVFSQSHVETVVSMTSKI